MKNMIVKEKFEVEARSDHELQTKLFDGVEPVLKRNQENIETILSAISAQLPHGMNLMQAESLAKAYQTVDNVVLQMSEDGTYSAVLRDDNGKILEHVPLKNASSGLATAVKEGFAVNCAIAGQMQMMQVSKQLEQIQGALSEAKDNFRNEKINAIVCSIQSLKEAMCITRSEDARISAISDGRAQLRLALANAYSFMREQAMRIPNEETSNGFFENWGFGKTKSEDAEGYFRYLIDVLPAYCHGVVMLAMTDAYVDVPSCSGLEFAQKLKELFAKCELQRRTALVPTIGGKDPGRLVSDFSRGIDAVLNFEGFRNPEKVQLKIPIQKRGV